VRRDLSDPASAFTVRYEALLKHYGLEGQKTQPCSPNENGDVEQGHHRLKDRMDQALRLRGSRDFASWEEYSAFLQQIVTASNAARADRFAEEKAVLNPLPVTRLESCKRTKAKVRASSTIVVAKNVYSVNSRLIGETVDVRLYANHLDVWYGQKCVEKGIARLRGEGRHSVNYRHIIDSLLRKPGAFARYRYREDLYPTTRFRLAWDALERSGCARPEKAYLRLLYLAARESESQVDAALHVLLTEGSAISVEAVKEIMEQGNPMAKVQDVHVDPVDLEGLDDLLEGSFAG
jgi:hypothetical protein